MKRIALHACCGPCLIEPLDALSKVAERVTVVYFNPNIHPVAEYELRRDTLLAYAQSVGTQVVELPYEPRQWLETAGAVAGDKEERCRACYRLRLGAVAAWAAENGHDAIATTLTVSPYQDAVAIAEAGLRAGRESGVDYAAVDFRDRYPEATRRSRELGMYRQNYCGCLMSDVEARSERAARRAARKASEEAG